jgi:mono/diheme cytochrome c family protein
MKIKRDGKRWPFGVLALVALAGLLVWFNLFRTERVAAERSLEDEFLYGSMGTEAAEGTPYWIWVILPKIFPEYLPGAGGYASLGLPWTEGHDLPVGVTKRVIGFERVGVNCAFCHVSQVRLSPDQARPTFYPGGPGHQVRIQDYQNFLFKSAADPRFNADTIMREIDAVTDLSMRERELYRYVLIPMTKRALLKQRDEFAWQQKRGRPLLGPGRTDPFNPMRFRAFKQPDDGSIGNSDVPSVWNQKIRTGHYIHWDGLSKVLHETAISSAIGDGARGAALDPTYLDKVEAYLRDLPPPKYPLAIDGALAAHGAPIFERACAECHTPGRARTSTVVPLAEIGTDPHRSVAWTQGQVNDWKRLAQDYQHKYQARWNLDSFSKQAGYVSGPLDGVWLRGPYLHNGSVPSLMALLQAPAARPQLFYRGNDVLDGVNVGFVSDVEAHGERTFFRYDVHEPGNSNAGHVYGTDLSDDDKRALVEYMKTL